MENREHVSIKKYTKLSEKLEKWIEEYKQLESMLSNYKEITENMYTELERVYTENEQLKITNENLLKKISKKKMKIQNLRTRNYSRKK